MDARRKTDIDKILVKFLGEIAHWNQTAAAKLLGLDRRRFNDYYNHRRETPIEVLIKIEGILQANGIYLDQYKSDKLPCFTKKLSHSERAKQVLADELWGKKRSGRPKKLTEIIRQRADELTKNNRIDAQLAKKYGFTSRFTMRVAVLVIQSGCIELIEALDKGKISFRSAEKIALLPKSLQQEIICRDEQTITGYFNPKKRAKASRESYMAKALTLMRKHPGFIELSQKTQNSVENIMKDVLCSLG